MSDDSQNPPAPDTPPSPGGAVPPPPPPSSGGAVPPPPSPPEFSAAPSASADRPLDIAAALTYGWQGFKSNVGPLILIALVILAVQVVFSGLVWILDAGFFLRFLINLASFVLSVVISMALIRAALMIVDGRTPELDKLVSGDGLLSYAVAALITTVLVVIGTVLCILPGLVIGYLLMFFGYAIVDNVSGPTGGAPQSDPVAALRTSFDITSANVGSLVLLLLVSVGLNMIGALLCGLGLLVTLPVTGIALAYAWRWFTQGHTATQPA